SFTAPTAVSPVSFENGSWAGALLALDGDDGFLGAASPPQPIRPPVRASGPMNRQIQAPRLRPWGMRDSSFRRSGNRRSGNRPRSHRPPRYARPRLAQD